MKSKSSLVLGLIILISTAAVFLRLLPHIPNFAPIGALALFAGMYATNKSWLLAPLAAMIVSDFIIGFDKWQITAVIYGSFLVYALLGIVVKNNKSLLTTVGGTFAGALFFYISTNFAVWAFSGIYPHTLQGLILCYEMALPFFRGTLMGDLFYVVAFVGAYELAYKLLASRLHVSLKAQVN
jgi:hypothetical protein